jgi:hypothetical protein
MQTLTKTTKQAVAPMAQEQLDRLIQAYGGQPACLTEDHANANADGSINVYLLGNTLGGWAPVNELRGMPADCLVDE